MYTAVYASLKVPMAAAHRPSDLSAPSAGLRPARPPRGSEQPGKAGSAQEAGKPLAVEASQRQGF